MWEGFLEKVQMMTVVVWSRHGDGDDNNNNNNLPFSIFLGQSEQRNEK